MQLNGMMGALGALALLAPGGAVAAPQEGFRGVAILASPATVARTVTVNGVAWSCEADRCQGQADRFSSFDSHMKECRKVAAALGPLASYSSRGLVMRKGSLGVCNRAALGVASQAAN